jgi:hypothetical protein
MTLEADIFAAIHADPRPITVERAQEIGVSFLQDDFPKRKQWIDWCSANGAQLVKMLNEEQT